MSPCVQLPSKLAHYAFIGRMNQPWLTNILVVTVPANCTDRLQPMDISLNKAVKDFLRREFQVWYSEKLSAQLDENPEGDPSPINLTSAAMKTEGAKWLVRMFEYVQQNPSLIVNGAGIPQALDSTVGL